MVFSLDEQQLTCPNKGLGETKARAGVICTHVSDLCLVSYSGETQGSVRVHNETFFFFCRGTVGLGRNCTVK